MSINLQPKPKSSAVDYVIDQIKNLLITRKIKPGDKLPSEFELADGLGVSRGSVRSAMKVIESMGVIDIQAGDGTYVCTSLNKNSFNPLLFSLLILQPSMDVLTQFREKIELDILDLIIQSDELTEKVLPLIEQNLQELKDLQHINAPVEAFAKNDSDFHSILAKNCGNIIFETIYLFIFEYFYPVIVESHHHQRNGLAAQDDHLKIFTAIKAKDFSLAKTAIRMSVNTWNKLAKHNEE